MPKLHISSPSWSNTAIWAIELRRVGPIPRSASTQQAPLLFSPPTPTLPRVSTPNALLCETFFLHRFRSASSSASVEPLRLTKAIYGDGPRAVRAPRLGDATHRVSIVDTPPSPSPAPVDAPLLRASLKTLVRISSPSSLSSVRSTSSSTSAEEWDRGPPAQVEVCCASAALGTGESLRTSSVVVEIVREGSARRGAGKGRGTEAAESYLPALGTKSTTFAPPSPDPASNLSEGHASQGFSFYTWSS
ncbi:hypothetical protein B0H14DRAFT_3483140 [Mycena olivaceomarginata]|nr:hypothetical protein B0H14DRAFT_3483140 [Mycena olivaceomarginata]